MKQAPRITRALRRRIDATKLPRKERWRLEEILRHFQLLSRIPASPQYELNRRGTRKLLLELLAQ
jgi:hypothetical protein